MTADNIRKRTVLITGAGGAGTITAIRHLRSGGKYRVVAVDANKYAYGLGLADKSYILPPAADDGYTAGVMELVEKENVDFYIPLVDEEILKAWDLKLKYPSVEVIVPKRDFCGLALDKLLMCRSFADEGIACPDTFIASELPAGIKFPLFAKPRTGRGSRNASVVDSLEQLEALICLSGLSPEKMIVQELVRGDEYTVSVVANAANSLFAVVPKKIILKRGITQMAVTGKVPEIEDVCRKIVEKFRPEGPFNVQLMMRGGRPVVFEVNPRYSTTLSLTLEAGVDEIGIVLDDIRGKGPSEMMPFREGVVLSRHWENVFYEEA